MGRQRGPPPGGWGAGGEAELTEAEAVIEAETGYIFEAET